MKTRWEQDKRLCTCFATGLASLYHCISSCISYTRRPRRGERALFRYNTFTAVYQSSTAGREVDDWFNESRQLVFVSRCTTGDRWILRFRYRQNIRMLAPPPRLPRRPADTHSRSRHRTLIFIFWFFGVSFPNAWSARNSTGNPPRSRRLEFSMGGRWRDIF